MMDSVRELRRNSAGEGKGGEEEEEEEEEREEGRGGKERRRRGEGKKKKGGREKEEEGGKRKKKRGKRKKVKKVIVAEGRAPRRGPAERARKVPHHPPIGVGDFASSCDAGKRPATIQKNRNFCFGHRGLTK